MKALMVSITLEQLNDILCGYRRIYIAKKPKLQPPFKCFVYCKKTTNLHGYKIWTTMNKVAGEFICRKVSTLDVGYDVSYELRISNFQLYKEAKELWNFLRPCVEETCTNWLRKPPKGWCYVEVKE